LLVPGPGGLKNCRAPPRLLWSAHGSVSDMTDHRRLSRRCLFLGTGALLLTRGAAAGVGLPDHLVPPQQLAFGKVIDDYYVRASSVTDAAARLQLVQERGRALRATLDPSAHVERWICVRYMASPNKGTLFVILGALGTRTNASIGFSSLDLSGKHPVDIGVNSDAGKMLLSMKDRSVFLASGALFPDKDGGLVDGNGQGIRSIEPAEFSDPAFLMRLDRVEQPAWLEDLLARPQ